MSEDRLAVVLLTYAASLESPRHLYAMRTAQALKDNLCYSGEMAYLIADDGSCPEHRERLRGCLEEKGSIVLETNAMRGGYGASYNLATQALHAEYNFFLMVEDDWELTKPLYIDPLVAALKDGIGCIRLGYLGWTQELRGHIASHAGMTFLDLDPFSPEPHVWSGHPRLETKDFQRSVGIWPEGVDPGSTEFIVAHRMESRENVSWPLDLGIRAGQIQGTLFAHIGSTQAREDQQ